MSRSALVLILLLVAASGYAWYQKMALGSRFAARETELLDTQAQLEARVGDLEEQGDSLRAEIEVLGRRLAATQLTVSSLPKKVGLAQRLRTSYPDLARTAWGVIEVYDDQDQRYVEYMAVPLWMSETFILDHRNASQCRATG